jgi:hypothetical protein
MRRLPALAVTIVVGLTAAVVSAPTGASAQAPPPSELTTFTGQAFDACTAPSAQAMDDWLQSPYRGIGIYVGGNRRACPQPNLTPEWVAQQAEKGWRFLPLYVGPQANLGDITDPAAQGTAAADDAVAIAGGLGFGPGSVLYYDMEPGYASAQADAVLQFLDAWTVRLQAVHYRSGVYGRSSPTVTDLVAHSGTMNPPDVIWAANPNGVDSPDDPSMGGLWNNHQRVHQYRGPHVETYGSTEIEIDSNNVDVGSPASPAPGRPVGCPDVYLATGFGPVQVCAEENPEGTQARYGYYSPLTDQFNPSTDWMPLDPALRGRKFERDIAGSDGQVGEFHGWDVVGTTFGGATWGTQIQGTRGRWGVFNWHTRLFYPQGDWTQRA